MPSIILDGIMEDLLDRCIFNLFCIALPSPSTCLNAAVLPAAGYAFTSHAFCWRYAGLVAGCVLAVVCVCFTTTPLATIQD
jgi:hypothetical protein